MLTSKSTFEKVPSDYAMLKIHTLPATGGDTVCLLPLTQESNRNLLGHFILPVQKHLANICSSGHLDMRSTIDSPTP